MSYDNKVFKLKFNTHSSHVCLHMGSKSVTWSKQCHVNVTCLSKGLLLMRHFVYIEFIEPANPQYKYYFPNNISGVRRNSRTTMRENTLFVDLLILIISFFTLGRNRVCMFEFQLRVAARHQRVIYYRTFLGTYWLYHEGTDITSQKNGLLEFYGILFDIFQNYFITFRFSYCTDSFVCTVMNRNINNSVDLSVLRNCMLQPGIKMIEL